MYNYLYIAVDFGGTVVTNNYPSVGKNIGAAPVLKMLIKKGHKIILNTIRDYESLDDAIKWFEDNDIELFGINVNPRQYEITTSKKVLANIYIDDSSINAPIKMDTKKSDKYFIDWEQICYILLNKYKLITKKEYKELLIKIKEDYE